MNAYLFYSPRFRPLTDDGEIMPGAYVQFYATGTTTPANVYSDAELTTPLDNPVVADAAGEFAAIYLHPSTTYRAILYDADDAEIWDIDPLAPPRDVPAGTVVFFHGNSAARDAAYPPALWQVLDGNNGTPNGIDRFVVLAGSSYNSGDTGGTLSASTTSAAGAHDHGGAVDGHAISTDEMPLHRHFDGAAVRRNTGTDPFGQTPDVGYMEKSENIWEHHQFRSNNTSARFSTSLEGGGQTHDHDITAESDHTHTVTVNPPYVALWALMRRS